MSMDDDDGGWMMMMMMTSETYNVAVHLLSLADEILFGGAVSVAPGPGELRLHSQAALASVLIVGLPPAPEKVLNLRQAVGPDEDTLLQNVNGSYPEVFVMGIGSCQRSLHVSNEAGVD